MRNVTWLLRWSRTLRRPLSSALLVMAVFGSAQASLGEGEPSAATDEAAITTASDADDESPAPVLRLAHDQPRFNAPERPEEAAETAPANSSRRGDQRRQSPALENASELDSDGWQPRGSIGRLLPPQNELNSPDESAPQAPAAVPPPDQPDANLPIRRPHIEEPLTGSDGNRRARDLQEEIERFEEDALAAEESAVGDEYDQPVQENLADAIPLQGSEGGPRGSQFDARPGAENAAAPIISAAAQRLERPIAQCIQYYYQRPENARERTPWGMLHAILPYGLDAQISTGRKRYNAIAWLAGNNPSRNLKILTTTRDGQIAARSGVGLQGHQGQLLAIFAQTGVPQSYPLYVNGRKFTVADLVRSEMAACKSGEELTFTLIGLSNYLPTDARWRAADGEMWDFERLIREELSQPVVGAACGGTHRLMSFSYALRQRRLEGLPMTGQWSRAAIFIDDFVDYTWQLQNRDGSFSTNWFEGREDNGDLDRKLQTTGHILEWLVFNSSQADLHHDRVTRSVTFLTNAMLENRTSQWQVGPKGHALRALSLYHQRMFDTVQPWLPSESGRAAPVGSGVTPRTATTPRRRPG